MKRPAFQFYAGDWLNCIELRTVSVGARGLWIDMLCLMRQGHEVGHLTHRDGRPITPEQLAKLVGESPRRVRALLSELDAASVASRSDAGAYVSLRMLRDELKYQDYLSGQSGAGKRGAAKRWSAPSPKSTGANGVAHPDPIERPWGNHGSSFPSSSSSSSSGSQVPAPSIDPTPSTPTVTARAVQTKPVISGPAKPLNLGKVHGNHVTGFCDWTCLPDFIFEELARKVPGDPDLARQQVMAWALDVRARWMEEERIVGDDSLAFWRHRWQETHGSSKPSAGGAVDVLAGLR